MCGDDDTKLNARAIEKQGSKSSAGSSLSRGKGVPYFARGDENAGASFSESGRLALRLWYLYFIFSVRKCHAYLSTGRI